MLLLVKERGGCRAEKPGGAAQRNSTRSEVRPAFGIMFNLGLDKTLALSRNVQREAQRGVLFSTKGAQFALRDGHTKECCIAKYDLHIQ